MTKIVELRPNKNLLNSNFEKYQFCADEIVIETEIDLKADIQRLELTADQDSYLETRLFALHNHLFKNPYDASCWFVDKNWIIWCFASNSDLKQIHILHDTNENVQNLPYNPSIGFASNNIIVISDGGECLKLLITGTNGCIKSFILHGAEPGVILDVQYVNTTSTIVVITCDIKSANEKKYTRLLILRYDWKNKEDACESFEYISKQSLRVNGALEYVCLEHNGQYLHSICQDYITFECPKDKESITQESKKTTPKYCWSQDEDSITIWFTVDQQHKDKIKVCTEPLKLLITVDENIFIQGQCQHRLDEKLTTWKYEKDTFKIELYKYETGLMWNEVIKGDSGGECVPNRALAAEIHSRLAHLCTDQIDSKQEGQPCMGFNADQLEECDLEGKDNLLQRIDLMSQKNTHLAILGTSNRVLFTNKSKFGQALCIRYDNNACLWLTGQVNDTEWNLEHCYTFPGLGYVEASKSNKKFCISPPDGSYVAILEHTRYIFLYQRPELNAKIGKQWIMDLSTKNCTIIGAAATNKYLIILTKNKLYRFNIFC